MDVQGLDGSGVNTPISMHKHRTCISFLTAPRIPPVLLKDS